MSASPETFFDAFRNDYPNSVMGESDKLPFNVGRLLLTEDELEGECTDWCVQFLSTRDCPSMLSMLITREVMRRVMEIIPQKMDQLLTRPPSRFNEPAAHEPSAADSPSFISNERLGELVLNELLQVCHNWTLNTSSEETMLPELSVHAIKNTRRKMEDRNVVLPVFGKLFQDLGELSYYAVFDGHGGVDAAKYAAIQLHSILGRRLQQGQQPKDAFRDAFLDTDRMFVNRANREQMTSGSTAVCVLTERDQLHVAWLGDSQALLVRRDHHIQLVTPHKPEDESEKKRIEDLGGCVVFIGAWRVNGTLSVSRAIGDAFHKPCISGEPDIETFTYETGDWLVLACDGLWDQLTYEDVTAMLNDSSDTSSTPAERLVREAKERGSGDNITAIVVRLSVPSNTGRQDGGTATDPNRTATIKADERNGRDSTEPRTEQGTEPRNSGAPPVGKDTVSMETSHLAVSMKRLADTELEVSDDDVDRSRSDEDEELGVFADSGSSVDMSQGSRHNFLRLSKVGSLEDALMSAAAELTSEFSPSSSGLSEIIHITTSEDTSGQSPDPSMEAGAVEMCVASMHKRSKRRSASSWQARCQKENQRPASDDADRPGTTPPCLRAGSPLMCEDSIQRAASSFTESCCHSASLPSTSGALMNPHHSAATQHGARLVSDIRSRISTLNAPSRWTIAVEVDADGGMFEEDHANSTMVLSSHW